MLRLILRRRCLGRDIRVELLLCNCLLDLRDRRSQSCDLIVSVWYRAHVRVRFWGAGLAQVLIVEVQVAGSSILQVGHYFCLRYQCNGGTRYKEIRPVRPKKGG